MKSKSAIERIELTMKTYYLIDFENTGADGFNGVGIYTVIMKVICNHVDIYINSPGESVNAAT